MKQIRLIFLMLILVYQTAYAGAKSDMYPSWLMNEESTDMIVGISAPCNDKEVAKQHAVGNAIMHWLINHGKGRIQVYVQNQIKGNEQGVQNSIEIVDQVIYSGFSCMIQEVYYNQQGECFVLCEITEDKSLTSNTVIFERTNMVVYNDTEVEWRSKLVSAYRLDDVGAIIGLDCKNGNTLLLVNDTEIETMNIAYDKASFRHARPKHSIQIPIAENGTLGLWQTTIIATAPLCPSVYAGVDSSNPLVGSGQVIGTQEIISSTDFCTKYQMPYVGTYVAFPLHLDYIANRILGITVDEAINISAQVPELEKWIKKEKKQTGLGDTWWKIIGDQDNNPTIVTRNKQLPCILGKHVAFWQAWFTYTQRVNDEYVNAKERGENVSTKYQDSRNVVPIWFMDANVRDFEAKDANKVGDEVALILQK